MIKKIQYNIKIKKLLKINKLKLYKMNKYRIKIPMNNFKRIKIKQVIFSKK